MKFLSNLGVHRHALLLCLLAIAGAAVPSLVHAETPFPAALEILDAWVRPAPPGAQVSAGYARLSNRSKAPLVISRVSSEVSRSAEIHDMSLRDGVMRMRRLADGLSLSPGESLSLQPGGMHVMLFGLEQALQVGHSLRLSFFTADGVEHSVIAEVREPRH